MFLLDWFSWLLTWTPGRPPAPAAYRVAAAQVFATGCAAAGIFVTGITEAESYAD